MVNIAEMLNTKHGNYDFNKQYKFFSCTFLLLPEVVIYKLPLKKKKESIRSCRTFVQWLCSNNSNVKQVSANHKSITLKLQYFYSEINKLTV